MPSRRARQQIMEARAEPRQLLEKQKRRIAMLQLNPPKMRAGIGDSRSRARSDDSRSRPDRPKTRPSALRHGAWSKAAVLPWEDPRRFDRLCRDLIGEWRPVGPAEEDAVFTLAKCLWRKHHIRGADYPEPSTPVNWWLPRELALDERLDGLIDRALRRLAHMRAMKALFAAHRDSPKVLAHRRANAEIEAPAVAVR
jgi:hypothetical protein